MRCTHTPNTLIPSRFAWAVWLLSRPIIPSMYVRYLLVGRPSGFFLSRKYHSGNTKSQKKKDSRLKISSLFHSRWGGTTLQWSSDNALTYQLSVRLWKTLSRGLIGSELEVATPPGMLYTPKSLPPMNRESTAYPSDLASSIGSYARITAYNVAIIFLFFSSLLRPKNGLLKQWNITDEKN